MIEKSNRELWWAFGAMLLITAGYGYVVLTLGSLPAASSFFGHTLGIIGFLLMIMTELLYTLRKRSRSARFGRMSSWLRFHIFTGLVGPYLVFLHTAWKFNGWAGIVMLLTLMVVLSGFIGRYIYTAIPRTVTGQAIDQSTIESYIRQAEGGIEHWLGLQDPLALRAFQELVVIGAGRGAPQRLFGRGLQDLALRYRWHRAKQLLPPDHYEMASELERLVNQKRLAERQKATLARARRLLSIWHVIHVPMGLTLFTTAIIHIGAAIYFATLLR
jgi:hypothetical protein